MNRKSSKGVAIMEFAFSMLVLIPLLLGTIGVGLRLIQSLRVSQLSRDSARMYARGLDFSQAGNKTILASLGADLGLKTDGTGNAVLVLTTVTYMDAGLCQSAGYSVDLSGNPIGCPNWKNWVFLEQIKVGNTTVRTSNLGSPLMSGPGRVTIDATTGKISLADQAGNSNDVAAFAAGGNPFVNLSGALETIPSGQVLYVTEAAISGFTMAPFVQNGTVYAYNVF